MDVILIGYGEIGQAIYQYFKQYHEIDILDLNFRQDRYIDGYEIMIVCFPYNDDFVKQVKEYQDKYNPCATIIFSTVAIGTTAQIEKAVHAPIEGKHPALYKSIKNWNFIVGGLDEAANSIAKQFFNKASKYPLFINNPEGTEIAKLQSTALYGLAIEYARYINSICKECGVPYEYINLYNKYYNALYQYLDMSEYSRYILDPPKGDIGGHCIVPNAKMLDKQYPSIFLKEIYRDKE